jgi:tRNA A37 N6-isopentenylltransferase MiaA
MYKTIQALYDGKINPAEQSRPKMKEYDTLLNELSKCRKEIFEQIESPLDKKLERLLEIQDKTFAYEMLQIFINGFRLGANIMLETCYDPHSNDDK